MHIESFRIQNFKCFEDVRLHLNPQVNVLTGVNNSGKTTVLEALALWSECFQHLRTTATRANAKLDLRTGDLRFEASFYLDQQSIRAVRSHDEADLFHYLDQQRTIHLIARIVEPTTNIGLDVGFAVRMTRGGTLEISPLIEGTDFDYPRFNELFRSIRAPVDAVFASPVSSLLFAEEFETAPKILRHVRSRESMLVLRNRLYQLRKDPVAFQELLLGCSQVLYGDRDKFFLEFTGDERNDVDLQVSVRTGADAQPRDISLLGSGALQLIELMLAVHSKRRVLTLVLLDEPDSHLHRDLQRRLIEVLRGVQSCQIFLTTHNESLLRSTRPEHIFHLEGAPTGEERPIASKPPVGVRSGLQPSPHAKVLQSLGSETALDLVNALESDRLVLVEGADDAQHIQAILDLQKIQWDPFRGMYWSFGGLDAICKHIATYRDLFRSIRNGGSLWDKAVLVFDRDCLPDVLRERLLDHLTRKLGIPVFIWESYTLEATLLREPEKTAALLVSAIGRLRRDRGSNESVNAADVGGSLFTARQAHLEAWKQRLHGDGPDAGNWEKRAFGQIHDRCRALRDSLDLDILKGFGDAEIQPKCRKYALDHLNEGRLDHLTDKREVFEILQAAALPFGVSFTEATYFAYIVQSSGLPTAWPEQWIELQRLLRAPPPPP